MSLFLSSEQMWDRSLGGKDSSDEITHWCGNIIWGFIAFVFKICFRYHVDGIDNLRRFRGERGVVVVGNHTSFLDVVFLYLTARPPQWIRFMGRDDLFDNAGGLVGQILSRVGAFPVKRDTADMKALKRAARMLKNDEIVGVMPEGTRRGKGTQVPQLHAGAAMVARMGKAVIVPAAVRDADRIKRKGRFFRFPKVTVEYGEPIEVDAFDFLPKEERLQACTWYAMRQVFAMAQRVDAASVDMVSLFPDSPDYSALLPEDFRALPTADGVK